MEWTCSPGTLARRAANPAGPAHGRTDAVRPAHMREFCGLFGAGPKDTGWGGSTRPTARLAVLPGAMHYVILESPLLTGRSCRSWTLPPTDPTVPVEEPVRRVGRP